MKAIGGQLLTTFGPVCLPKRRVRYRYLSRRQLFPQLRISLRLRQQPQRQRGCREALLDQTLSDVKSTILLPLEINKGL